MSEPKAADIDIGAALADQLLGQWESRMRLMKAAPELLAALKALVSDVLEYERINNLAPSPGKQDCWQSVTNARAAIAKAEGRTP